MWRNRNLDFLIGSLVISRAGDTFTFLALAIRVDSLYTDPTQSARSLGIVLMAFALPQLVFGLFAGTLVDRWDRRRVMIAADLARAALIPLLVFLRTPGDILWAAVLAFAVSSFSAFFYPARTALLPAVVEDEELMAANSWMQVGETVARLVGPILAGMVIGLWGGNVAFLFDSASFVGSALCLFLVWGVESKVQTASAGGSASAWKDLVEGVRYALGNRLLQAVTIGIALALLGIGGVDVLIVPFTRFAFNAPPEALGLLMTVQGAGMLVGGLMIGAFSNRWSPVKIAVASTALLAFGLGAFGMAPSYLVGLMVVPVFGFALPPLNASLQTLLQTEIPGEMLGRAGALVEMASSSAYMLSMAAAGPVSTVVGLRHTYVLSGVLVMTAAVTMAWLLRSHQAGSRIPAVEPVVIER